MPEGIKVLENPASCVFFVYIHESSCELVDLCFERHFSFFYQDFLFERSSFYFQFTFNFTQKRMSYAHFQQPDWFDCVSDLKVRWCLRLKSRDLSSVRRALVTSEGSFPSCYSRKIIRWEEHSLINLFGHSNTADEPSSQLRIFGIYTRLHDICRSGQTQLPPWRTKLTAD